MDLIRIKFLITCLNTYRPTNSNLLPTHLWVNERIPTFWVKIKGLPSFEWMSKNEIAFELKIFWAEVKCLGRSMTNQIYPHSSRLARFMNKLKFQKKIRVLWLKLIEHYDKMIFKERNWILANWNLKPNLVCNLVQVFNCWQILYVKLFCAKIYQMTSNSNETFYN